MNVDNGGGGGDSRGGGDVAVPLTAVFAKGDRKLYKVELRPDDTTIVSWKKLVREGNRQLQGSSSSGIPEPPSSVSRPVLAPGQSAEIDKNNAETANRFSSVIEKIERLYMGNDSGDEDDLRNVPHDDGYDTEDSFIDDAELDEYFKVDHSTTKHDGFFINRGKLESTETPVQSGPQPKKRRRKDNGKAQDVTENNNVPNKRLKGDKSTAGKIPASHEKSFHTSQSPALAVTVCEDINFDRQQNASKTKVKKIKLNSKTAGDPSSVEILNGLPHPSLAERKELYRQKSGTFQLSICSNKLGAAGGTSDASHQNSSNKFSAGRPLYNLDEQETSDRSRKNNALIEHSNVLEGTVSRSREKTSLIEHSDVFGGTQNPMQMKSPNMHKKDASSVRLKSSMLEKAIRELERMVAESRPPAMGNKDTDASQQAIKRRLPREIKLKLAKVAHLAQASHGKISKELLSRLMSFLGHLMQLRTLKRNLKEMINMGLPSKQEKNERLKEIKEELTEMIKVQLSLLESKALDRLSGASDKKSEEKESQGRLHLDAALEDKICDLYDLYVDGLDEDARPLIRKLYTELAQLWPNNLMDNHGIKEAICNAKERQRALISGNKDQEKNKRKNVMPTQEEIGRAKISLVAQSQYVQERFADGSRPGTFSASDNKQLSKMMVHDGRLSPSTNSFSLKKLEQKSICGSSGNDLGVAKLADNSKKKKKKRDIETKGHINAPGPAKLADNNSSEKKRKKHEIELNVNCNDLAAAKLADNNFLEIKKCEIKSNGNKVQPERSDAHQVKENHKFNKHPTLVPPKLSVQPAAHFFKQSS